LSALKVWNPSFFGPAITPKKPSANITATTAKYCSELAIAKWRKYVHKKVHKVVNVATIMSNVDGLGTIVFMDYLT
jgi:hypothetical protein